ncbi:Pre-mRNA-splicing factor ATP-dependent RNA helicase PRP16 [Cryptosporidium felis]|nr:Pre-mRNA-splicing factor ATP-dependent RNA helicase PRP16 [Cryptosporidium felis]
MYTEQTFLGDLLPNSVPEIQRTNLSNVVLLLKSLGSRDVFSFPFIDPPSPSSISSSLYQLWSLGALDDRGELTDLGLQMARFPLDPPLSKVLLTASRLECLIEVVVVVAMLSVQSVFFRPKDRIEESEAAREKFSVPESDHLTLLNVFVQWKRHKSQEKWSERHFLHQKALVRVEEVFNQILEIYSSVMGQERPEIHWRPNPLCWDNLRKAFCSGYFHNSSKIRAIGQYVNLSTSIPAYIHPSSSLFLSGVNPDYVIYHEVVITSKEYMNTVSAIDPEWLVTFAPYIFKINSKESKAESRPAPISNGAEESRGSSGAEGGSHPRGRVPESKGEPEADSSSNLDSKPSPGPSGPGPKRSRGGDAMNRNALSFSFDEP